jgi:hypothetical protein
LTQLLPPLLSQQCAEFFSPKTIIMVKWKGKIMRWLKKIIEYGPYVALLTDVIELVKLFTAPLG